MSSEWANSRTRKGRWSPGGPTPHGRTEQLDLGLRTVQRRVRRLMELARVTTRLQLGWHARELGWVSREDPR
ncbi:hypothetical protein GCM10010206_32990 [Streptomyces cinerochromogenes]|nr:hypothetical protein GCM10010206_32990 [Streptomyces cinerochromogenes]